MPRKHVNVSFTSYNSLSSYISEQWLKHRKIFKSKKLRIGELLNYQDDNKQFYMPQNCNLVRNVSSIELEKLLHPDSSFICPKKKNKHKKSSDDQMHPHLLQYSRIMMQTCQNKGCMCKPIIQGRPKCQINDEVQVTEEEEPIVTKNKKNQTEQTQTRRSRSITSERAISESKMERLSLAPNAISESKIKRLSVAPNATSESKMERLSLAPNGDNKDTQTAEVRSENKEAADTKTIKYEMCTKNPCDPCPDDIKYCVPHNIEQLHEESGDKEIEYLPCGNKELCTCDEYDTEEALQKGMKLPGKNICIQRPAVPVEEEEQPIEEPEPANEQIIEEEKPVEQNNTCKCEPQPIHSSSSRVGCCFKKKKKRESEKYIQTCCCCANKSCQPEPLYSCFCADKETNIDQIICTDNVSPICADNVRSIWICAKCGKVYNNSCKRCDRPSCTKNTIYLPPTSSSGFCHNQADILKTLITMEAKQNFRQIDNILLELNQQRNQIRKLGDMYHYIAAKSRNSISPKASFENGLENAPKVYICEGCEIDVNRNILRTIMTRADKKRRDDEYEKEWEDSVPDNDKYIKNIINKRKRRPSNGRREIRIKTLEDDGSQTSDDIKHYEDGIIKLNGKKHKVESTGTDTMAVISRAEPDDRINVETQSEKPNHLMREEIESEKIYVNEFSNTDLEEQPNDRTFIGWCKKSLTSLKQCQSRDVLKQKCQRLKQKISECRKSFTESSEAQSEEDKLKCSYQYFQSKLDKCKLSLSNMRQGQHKDQRKCDYQYIQEKIGDCKKSLTNMRKRCTFETEKSNSEFLQNKITQCREKTKENKRKNGIMNYCK